MKRRAKYSLIIVVVLVVILGLGFGIWKIFFAPRPLKIKGLENMHITTTRSSIPDGWDLAIRDIYNIKDRTGGEVLYGKLSDNGNIFPSVWDAMISENPLAVEVWITEANEAPNIQAGDTIEIAYDGGQTLKIYLPRVTTGDLALYVATDGSTYYNRRLTKLAQKALIPSEKSK